MSAISRRNVETPNSMWTAVQMHVMLNVVSLTKQAVCNGQWRTGLTDQINIITRYFENVFLRETYYHHTKSFLSTKFQ